VRSQLRPLDSSDSSFCTGILSLFAGLHKGGDAFSSPLRFAFAGSRFERIEAETPRLVVGRWAMHELSNSRSLSLAEEEPSYGLSASRRTADALL
jgi:hypothetical protein